MINNMIIILEIIFIMFALFYLFYCWLDLRQRQRDYKRFKEKIDEELIRFLEELTDDNNESGNEI